MEKQKLSFVRNLGKVKSIDRHLSTVLHSKKALSGEVFKENFTDIFQTNLEQVAYSLELQKEGYPEYYKSPRQSRSNLLTNRRFVLARRDFSNRRFDRLHWALKSKILMPLLTNQRPLKAPIKSSYKASLCKPKALLEAKKILLGRVAPLGFKIEDFNALANKSTYKSKICTWSQSFASPRFVSNEICKGISKKASVKDAFLKGVDLSASKSRLFKDDHREKERKFLQKRKALISLNINIGDFLSSGDKIGEKNLFSSPPLNLAKKKGVETFVLLTNRCVALSGAEFFFKSFLSSTFLNKRKSVQALFGGKSYVTKKAEHTKISFLRVKQNCFILRTSKVLPDKTELCKTPFLYPLKKRACLASLKGLLWTPKKRGKKIGIKSERSLLKTDYVASKSRFFKSDAKICKGKDLTAFKSANKIFFAEGAFKGLQSRALYEDFKGEAKFCITKKKKAKPIISSSSGRVVSISKTGLTLQKTQPILFYNSAHLHVKKGEWVKEGSPILTLTHQTLITGDIVQGIPRIEQLFEAFTSPPSAFKDKRAVTKFKDVHDTLHSQVRDIFRKHWLKSRLPIAVRKSLEEIGYSIVEMIQKVYLSQGVLIADKHIEIIIRQIASKGQILDSGTTGLFLEEILPIRQIENANLTTPGKKCLYVPAVMGLTATALNSDSFISAASFQETTRVLSRDAIVGKSDFLRGLKEKVVIGDLISAGTGLDIYFIYNTI